MSRIRGRLSMMLSALVVSSAAFALPAGAAADTVTFDHTGAAQTWTVPAGVTSATFDVYGAGGGAFTNATDSSGGRATATIPVTPRAEIGVNVGGSGFNGGFNGGGSGVAGSAVAQATSGSGAAPSRTGRSSPAAVGAELRTARDPGSPPEAAAGSTAATGSSTRFASTSLGRCLARVARRHREARTPAMPAPPVALDSAARLRLAVAGAAATTAAPVAPTRAAAAGGPASVRPAPGSRRGPTPATARS